MSLKTIEFQDTYWSGENNLIDEFYVPCLKQSVEYDRAVGYFSSSILCYIANGLYNFISNGGRMRMPSRAADISSSKAVISFVIA